MNTWHVSIEILGLRSPVFHPLMEVYDAYNTVEAPFVALARVLFNSY